MRSDAFEAQHISLLKRRSGRRGSFFGFRHRKQEEIIASFQPNQAVEPDT
jgi:hypothetical protein